MDNFYEHLENMSAEERAYAVHLGVKYSFPLCAECDKNPACIEVVSAERGAVKLCLRCVEIAAAGKALIKADRRLGK